MPVTYAAVTEVSTADELKKALNDSSFDTVKLAKDVTLTETIPARGDVTLDLNGKVLNLNSKQITVNRDTLTLSDSNPNAEHRFKEDATGLWVLDNSGDKPFVAASSPAARQQMAVACVHNEAASSL